MFNHLRKYHPDFVKNVYGIWKKEQFDELIKSNAPFPIEWEVKDDFDEEVSKTLYGCLGCNKTYTTQHNASKHCLGTCKKDHNANLRRIQKEEKQDKEKREKKGSESRMRWLNRTAEQIFACTQQDVEYYGKKWTEVGARVSRYLCAMQHDSPHEYIFFSTMNPVFVDDKKKMESQESQFDKEITKWQRMYEDILPLLWSETSLVSHSAYDELEQMIRWTQNHPDYKF